MSWPGIARRLQRRGHSQHVELSARYSRFNGSLVLLVLVFHSVVGRGDLQGRVSTVANKGVASDDAYMRIEVFKRNEPFADQECGRQV